MSIKIPRIKKPDDRKDADLNPSHQDLVEYLNLLIKERRRLIEELETLKIDDPSNIDLISSIENQISEVSDQIREEIKYIKAKQPFEWEIVKSEVKEKRILEKKKNIVLLLIKDKSAEEILDITLKLIEEGSISVVKELSDLLIEPLSKDGQLRIAMKMIEVGEVEQLINTLYKFTLINTPQDIKEVVLSLINRGRSDLIITYAHKFLRGKETQFQIAEAFIENEESELLARFYFLFRELEKNEIFELIKSKGKANAEIEGLENLSPRDLILDLINNNYQINNLYDILSTYLFPLIDKEDSESLYLIFMEIINKFSIQRIFYDFEGLLDKFDENQLLEIAIKLCQRGAGYLIKDKADIFLKEKRIKIRIMIELIKSNQAMEIILNFHSYSDILDLLGYLFKINPELTYSSIKENVRERVGDYRDISEFGDISESVELFLKSVNATPIQKLTILNATYEGLCEIKYRPVIN